MDLLIEMTMDGRLTMVWIGVIFLVSACIFGK